MPIYKFRNCSLDTREHSLSVKNRNIRLTSKTFDILQLLVRKAGKVVTRDEILKIVWKNCFVEEGNISVHISRIRRSLEPKSIGGRIIETVHGAGYRFLPEVRKFNTRNEHSPATRILLERDSDTVSSNQLNLLDGKLIINIEVIKAGL